VIALFSHTFQRKEERVVEEELLLILINDGLS
jgi:hypothetical protein